MRNWPLCLHPTCRAEGVQAVTRGLCHPCYTTIMRWLSTHSRSALNEQRLVEDGKLLPASSGDCPRKFMEYSERIDWFMAGRTEYPTEEQQTRELLGKLRALTGKMKSDRDREQGRYRGK